MFFIQFARKHLGFFFGILLLFACRWSLADHYRVPSGSMLPTIEVGDHLAVSKIAYDIKVPFTEQTFFKTGEPQRGDIVVFLWPEDPSKTFVKRLIGLPGDHIEIENGFVRINGKSIGATSLDQSDIQFYSEKIEDHQFLVQRKPSLARSESSDFLVPEGKYFFLGDNRDESLDSRFWGFVDRRALKGKVHFVLWNIDSATGIPMLKIERVLKPIL